MKKNFVEVIKIDDYSKTPKYKQIINSILNAIETNELKKDDKLPSVNKLLIEFDISRDTIVKAYDYLKSNQIIESVPGKGFYVRSSSLINRHRILLLFNKLSAHKKIIYDSFSNAMGEDAAIDFYIYNNDFKLFKRILLEKINNDYSHFVIISHFLEGGQSALDIIQMIPSDKLIILDKEVDGITGHYASVYQDFESDIHDALLQMLPKLSNYKTLKLIFPEYTYHPSSIKYGFIRFCDEYAFKYKIVNNIQSATLKKGDVYINLMEDDLVHLIKRSKEKGFVIGQELGIISYNDTLLKDVLLDGITTVSTDFALLGQTAASFVLTGKKEHIKNPFHVKYRNSL